MLTTITRSAASRRTFSLRWFYTALLVPYLLAVPLRADSNYVTNGGFEIGATSGKLSPAIPGDLIYVFGVGGATNIGAWTVSAISINIGSSTTLSVTDNPPQVPASGCYAVDFDPFWNISTSAIVGPALTGTPPQISRSFSLPAGNYVLIFDGATEHAAIAPASRPLTVTLSDTGTLNQTVTASEPDDVGYTLFQFDF